jgi:RNase H-fold protein (predicted Holliday junction resolvase)
MVVLGISLGTRTTGIAIIHDKELLESRTLTVRMVKPGAHTEAFDHYIRQYSIGTVVLKVPPLIHITGKLKAILKRALKLFEYHGCLVQYRDTEAIKEAVPHIANKHDLMAYVTEHYPVLTPIRDKELLNKNKYHEKMFEAVVIAHLHDREKNSP